MSGVPKRLFSPQEYLEKERDAPFKSEYYRGEIFAMPGASFKHCRVKDNLARKIGNQLEDGPCQVITSDLRVKVDATGLYTYPDVIIVCEQPRFEDNVFDTLVNPLALVEVLSDSTEKYDRGAKFAQYRQIASLREFILAAQDQILIERYVRQPDDSWLLTIFSDPSKDFVFASVPVRIPLAEIYRGVAVPEPSDPK